MSYQAFDKTNNMDVYFYDESDAINAQADGWIDSYTAGSMPVYVPTLEEAQASKMIELGIARDNALSVGALYNNLHYACDPASKSDLLFCVTVYDKNSTLPDVWIANDGQLSPVTADDLTGILTAIDTFVEGQYSKEYSYIQQVNAATTVDQVNAITWA